MSPERRGRRDEWLRGLHAQEEERKARRTQEEERGQLRRCEPAEPAEPVAEALVELDLTEESETSA